MRCMMVFLRTCSAVLMLAGLWFAWPFVRGLVTGDAPLSFWLPAAGALTQLVNFLVVIAALLPGAILWTLAKRRVP